MEVRPATNEDTNDIFWLLMEMAKENTSREVSVSGTVDEIRRITGMGDVLSQRKMIQ